VAGVLPSVAASQSDSKRRVDAIGKALQSGRHPFGVVLVLIRVSLFILAHVDSQNPKPKKKLDHLLRAFDNLIWPHRDTYIWPHL